TMWSPLLVRPPYCSRPPPPPPPPLTINTTFNNNNNNTTTLLPPPHPRTPRQQPLPNRCTRSKPKLTKQHKTY
ncbi:unnamed protein product, partial [Ceratitis capitata]